MFETVVLILLVICIVGAGFYLALRHWRISLAIFAAIGVMTILYLGYEQVMAGSARRRIEAAQAESVPKTWQVENIPDPASGVLWPRGAYVWSDDELCALSVEERLDGSRLTGIYCAGLPLEFNDFGHTPVSIKFDTMKTSTNMKVERFSDDEDDDSLYISSNQDPATNWLGGEEQRFYSYNDFLHRIASSGNLAIELNFGDAGTHWIRFSLKGSRHALTTIAALPGSPPIRPLTPKQSQDSSDE